MTKLAELELERMRDYIEQMENETDLKALSVLIQDAALAIGTFGNAQRARIRAMVKNDNKAWIDGDDSNGPTPNASTT